MLRRMLEDHVAGITVVDNGADAVAAVHQSFASEHPFDMVLMDRQMPVLTGYEATLRLRAEGYDGAIIALTAGAVTGDREKCLAVGCTDYLPKPLDSEQLLRTLQKYSTSRPVRS
jgi:CheY-like chemotaxis protein